MFHLNGINIILLPHRYLIVYKRATTKCNWDINCDINGIFQSVRCYALAEAITFIFFEEISNWQIWYWRGVRSSEWFFLLNMMWMLRINIDMCSYITIDTCSYVERKISRMTCTYDILIEREAFGRIYLYYSTQLMLIAHISLLLQINLNVSKSTNRYIGS